MVGPRRRVEVALRVAWVLARCVAARTFARARRAMRTWRRDWEAGDLRARRMAARHFVEPRAARKGRRGLGWRLATSSIPRLATNRAAWGCRDSEDFSRERSDPGAGKVCARVHRLLPAWLFPRRCDSPRRT